MPFKVGDKVKIVDNVDIAIHEGTLKYLGSIVTISEVLRHGCYKVKEDSNNLIWDDYMFDKVVPNHKQILWEASK